MAISRGLRFFFLDDADLERVALRRGAHNRLGLSVQLTTVRCPGTFLADPADVPAEVLDFLAGQLGIADPSCIKQYAARPATQWEHAAEIRQAFGYRAFSNPQAVAELRGFLAARAWTRIEPSKALFDAKAPVLRRRVDPRRTATLVATVRSLAAAAVDDALDLFGVLMATKLIRVAERTSRAERLAALPRLARASATLAAAVAVLLEATDAGGGNDDRRSATGRVGLDVAGVWAAIEQVAPRERLAAAVHTVEELARRTPTTTARGGPSWSSGSRWCAGSGRCWPRGLRAGLHPLGRPARPAAGRAGVGADPPAGAAGGQAHR